MRAVLGAALAAHAGTGPITGAAIDAELGHPPLANEPSSGETGAGLRPWIEQTLKAGALSMPELESEVYRAAVGRTGGNLSAAARLLGITRAQLAYRLGARGGRAAE